VRYAANDDKGHIVRRRNVTTVPAQVLEHAITNRPRAQAAHLRGQFDQTLHLVETTLSGPQRSADRPQTLLRRGGKLLRLGNGLEGAHDAPGTAAPNSHRDLGITTLF